MVILFRTIFVSKSKSLAFLSVVYEGDPKEYLLY